MFDDPRKELKRLEDQLLAAEKQDDDFERFYSEIYEEFGQEATQADHYGILNDTPHRNANDYGFYAPQSLEQEPRFRNYANGYGQEAVNRQPQRSVSRYDYADEDIMEADRFEKARPRQKGIRGLVICACTECIGIAAVVVYWIIRLMP